MASIHENISLLDTLGKGRYGVVRLARNIVGVPLPPHSQKTGEMYAVKVIHRGTVSESILQQELSVLRVLKDEVHDSNLVRIVDIYEDSCLVHVVMEYMGGGDLYHRLLTKKCFSGDWDYDTAFKRQMGGGGLVAYLGTSDVQEVERRIDAGDKDADFYFDAMIYQIAKDIGGMATVMNGQVDRVILTGEIARSQRLVERLRRRVEFIAPVEVVPGAVEMDALVAGALRMLRGQEEIRDYDTERND